MRSRFLLPACLVALVAALSLFMFGGSSRQASAAGSLPVPPGVSPTLPSSLHKAVVNASSSTQKVPKSSNGPLAEPTVKIPSSLASQGKVLFIYNCSTCHGTNAVGSVRSPNLVGLGPATVDFWVSTGRMPLATPSSQATIKPPRFDTE